MKKPQEPAPGDGIRSLKTSNVFRVVNFELYAKPNRIIMTIGLCAMAGSLAYIAYMRHKYEGMGYYVAVSDNGEESFVKKKSRWD
ncbi:hypothetical protein FOCC_FOCC017114 [Frankliniella occidentalis]|uniref:Small integral membrane protein 8 n=1 Tax=Frankliniella occidentalis TaxID=133901 RepID=A0A6J1T2C7_FRAOC|nr:small integral membrane protein 8 [Frankliniella occidentalis]KAE8737419.1 hypothetical protein FOCC_FOCC017114 [Frankliniella occidentalis]